MNHPDTRSPPAMSTQTPPPPKPDLSMLGSSFESITASLLEIQRDMQVLLVRLEYDKLLRTLGVRKNERV
jgi:hypothetical protein